MAWSDREQDVEVEPSIYAADFATLGGQVETLLDAGARVFHVDVGDGHFIDSVTFGPIVLQSIAPIVAARGGELDCHLMVTEPERHFEQIKAAGGTSVTFHVEASASPPAAIRLARSLGLGVGVAFNPATPVATAAAAAQGADLALCMSIQPGRSGQAFMPSALGRMSELRRLLPAGVHVQVDGGVSAANAAAVCAAGANLLVAGSAIFWQDDLAAAYRGLCERVELDNVTTVR
jgi:ribulose-phosphate 3-epimerase